MIERQLQALALETTGWGKQAFVEIARGFPNLMQLTVFSHAEEDLTANSSIAKAIDVVLVLQSCAKLQHLKALSWCSPDGFYGSWGHEWDFLLQLVNYRPTLNFNQAPGDALVTTSGYWPVCGLAGLLDHDLSSG
uniref:Uncharacterized protein n=1 Tax=Moniliophthora roreri TaxID=221103 RepID=A0A0W0FHQ8_MONRR